MNKLEIKGDPRPPGEARVSEPENRRPPGGAGLTRPRQVSFSHRMPWPRLVSGVLPYCL